MEQALWRLQLTVRNGPDVGKRCVVDRDVVTVGKRGDSDLVLTDASVSRQHLRISRMPDDRWALHDLGSTNGTFVNGTRVNQTPLSSGDRLQVGRTLMIYTGSPNPSANLSPLRPCTRSAAVCWGRRPI